MKNTVIILNEELCSMSLAFEKAGYEILAACETDRRSCDIYMRNIKNPIVYDDILNTDIYSLPDSDVIVGKLEIYDWKNRNDVERRKNNLLMVFLDVIRQKMPKCVLCEINTNSVKTKAFYYFMSELSSYYKVDYQIYKINEIINIPVNERKMYVVGIREDIGKDFRFMNEYNYQSFSMSEVLEYKKVDEWYNRVNPEQIKFGNSYDKSKDGQFLCWKEHGYVRCENVIWNNLKIPLVNVNGKIRRITHREVARLKGYPDNFHFDISNKAWLYTRLMYASNIHLLYLIAYSLECILNDRSLINQQVARAIRFEELFEQFLGKYYDVQRSDITKDNGYDFVIEKNNSKIFFYLKLYTNKYINGGNVLRACERIYTKLKSSDKVVLVWGNEIDEQIKQMAKENYSIEIWDIANILYLFQEFPEINNEFIALLNYTINDIEIKSPDFNIIEDSIEDASQNDLLTRLERIKPGQAEWSAYEQICVEILKYVFGEYLSLWREQQKSNEGLYKFDLCCKVKHGDNHEFFDTLKHFFNTKYVVFEFKNYTDLITQREIYTTEKYLYKTALRCVAIIVSRKGADNNALIAAKGCLRENGKLILCLSDEDLHNLVNLKLSEEKPTAEVLADMLDDMLINLEK